MRSKQAKLEKFVYPTKKNGERHPGPCPQYKEIVHINSALNSSVNVDSSTKKLSQLHSLEGSKSPHKP